MMRIVGIVTCDSVSVYFNMAADFEQLISLLTERRTNLVRKGAAIYISGSNNEGYEF